MPLNVSIAINGRPLESITIGRIELFKGKNRWHEYIVQVDGEPEAYATFSHLYSDGAQTCVRKALDALARRHGAI
jgi:hypothetical protein